MENTLNLASIIKEEHERNWIALSKDNTKVIAYDKSLVQLKKKVDPSKVVFMRVPPSDAYLSF